VASYPYFLDFLKNRKLKVAIVSQGQRVANAKLISVTIAARRRGLKVVNGELVADRGEKVVDVFKINGNTDLVRLRDSVSAGDALYISRSQVQYAIEIKTVEMMATRAYLNCSLREAMLQLVGLNAENSFTSPAVLLTNYSGKHYVLYIDWPKTAPEDSDADVRFSLEIRHFKNLNEAIDFAENLTLREPGTREFLRRCTPTQSKDSESDCESVGELFGSVGIQPVEVEGFLIRDLLFHFKY
jgi:hypothetical protein